MRAKTGSNFFLLGAVASKKKKKIPILQEGCCGWGGGNGSKPSCIVAFISRGKKCLPSVRAKKNFKKIISLQSCQQSNTTARKNISSEKIRYKTDLSASGGKTNTEKEQQKEPQKPACRQAGKKSRKERGNFLRLGRGQTQKITRSKSPHKKMSAKE